MVKNMLTRKLMRDFKHAKLQFISMMLLCALGTFVFSGLDAAWRLLDHSVETYFTEQNLADCWVQIPGANREALRRISLLDSVEDAQMRRVVEMDTDLPSDATVKLYGFEGAPRMNVPVLKGGQPLAEHDKRGCLLEEQFALANGLTVGDRVKLSKGDFSQIFQIRGLITSPEQIITSKGVASDPLHYGFCLVNSDAVTAFPYTEVMVCLSEGASDAAFRAQIRHSYPDAMIVDQQAANAIQRIRNDVQMFRNLSYVFPLLAFAVAAMIVLTTITRMVENQRMHMGTLKALGYGGSKITRHYLCYALYPSVVGALLGMWMGRLTLPQLLWDMEAVEYVLPPQLSQPISGLTWLVFGLSVGLSCLVCYVVYRKSAKEVTAALLRPKPPKEGSRTLLERFPKFWAKLRFNTKMVVRNMFRNKLRTSMTLIGILCCNMLIITTQGLQDSVKYFVGQYYDSVIRYDMRVDLTEEGGTLESYRNRLEAQRLDGLMTRAVTLAGPDVTRIATLEVLSPGQQSLYLGREYSYLEIPQEGIVVTEKLCSVLGIREGDMVSVWLAGDDECLRLPVTRIAFSNLSQGAYMHQSAWEALKKGAFRPDALLLTGPTEACARAVDDLDELDEVKYPEKQYRDNLSILNSLTTIFSLMGGAAFGLAFVICYNMGILNFMERSREYATLKVLGYHQKEIKRLMVRESNLVALLGTLLGILPGIWLTAVVMKACESEQTVYGAYVTLQSILVSSVLTFGFSRLIQATLTRNVRKIDMVTSLKSVE